MSTAAQATPSIPLFAPDGSIRAVPANQVSAALSAGGKRAVQMRDPQGTMRYVPEDLIAQAQKAGGTLANAAATSGVASYQLSPTDLANKVLQSEGLPGVHRPDAEVAGRFAASPSNPLNQAETPGVGADALSVAVRGGQFLQDQIAKGSPQAIRANTTRLGGGHPVEEIKGMITAPFHQASQVGQDVASGAYGDAAVDALAAGLGMRGLVEGAKGAAEAGTSLAKQGTEAIANSPIRNNPITNAALGPNPEAIPAGAALTKATRPRNSIQDFKTKAATALPDMRRAADTLGIDSDKMTLHDAEDAVVQAKKDVWGDLTQNYLGPTAKIHAQMDPVANRIQAVGDRFTDILKDENPAVVDAIQKAAGRYRGKTMPVEDIETRIQELNNELRSQQATYKVQESDLRRSPQFAGKFAELDGLRDLESRMFEQYAGPGADTLKQRYGALKTMEDVISRRIPVVDRSAINKLYETSGRMAGAGDIARGVIAREPGTVAAGVAKMRMGQNAQLLNDPDFLIQQAFKKTTPRPAPGELAGPGTPPRPAGLLGQGAIPLDESPLEEAARRATPPSQPPPVDATTRAVRKGLLLPEHTGAIPLGAPSPESTPMSVKPNYTIARDPKTGQMRKVYLSSGGGELIRDSGGTAPAGPGASRFLPIRTMSDGSSIVRDTLTGRILKLPPK